MTLACRGRRRTRWRELSGHGQGRQSRAVRSAGSAGLLDRARETQVGWVRAAVRAGGGRAGWGGAGRPAQQQPCQMSSPGGPPRPLRRRSGSACCARRGSGGAAPMVGPRGHLTGRGLQRYSTSVDRRRRPPARLDRLPHFVSMNTIFNKTLQAHFKASGSGSKGRTAVRRLRAVGGEAWDERNPTGLPRQAS